MLFVDAVDSPQLRSSVALLAVIISLGASLSAFELLDVLDRPKAAMIIQLS